MTRRHIGRTAGVRRGGVVHAVIVSGACALASAGIFRLLAIALRDRPGRSSADQPVSSARRKSFDAETDSLSLIAAAHLAEYDALRREIDVKIQQYEQTYMYLYAFIGAVLASQFLLERFPDVEQSLRSAPALYLVVALALLWFPVNAVITTVYVAHAAAYITTVLSPKLTELAEDAERGTVHGLSYNRWQRGTFPPPLRGQLRWECFLDLRFRSPKADGRLSALMAPLTLHRLTILYLPAILVIVRYAAIRGSAGSANPTALLLEICLLAGIVVLTSASAYLSIAQLRDLAWLRRARPLAPAEILDR